MELGVILELIGSVGFPIAMVLALGLFVYKLWQQSVEREKALMSEITANRIINQQFAEIIGGYKVTLTDIQNDVKDIKDTLHINKTE